MSSQANGGAVVPSARTNQKTFLDDVILTFSSPMAWLLVVALILTWSGVAIVLFDLLDYKTLAEYTSYCDDPVCLSSGLPPPSAIAKRGLRPRGGVRPIKSSPAGVPGGVTAQEGIDWLEMIWTFAASLVAPDEEEEGIHQLTETLTFMSALLEEIRHVSSEAADQLEVPNPESTQEKRKRKRGDSGGRVDSEEDGDKKKKKKENQRPNYFVSIPITNTQISSAVTEVQEAVLQQEPQLAKAMIPVPTLHITLLVTHLANQEQVDLAASALAQVKPSLAELLVGRDLVLPFSGIGHFRKEVVFVGLARGQHRHTLDSLAGLLRSRFEEQGLVQGDSRGFEPHLTIMKLSRASKLRSQGVKRVDPALYSNYTNKFFGDQTVERVDLCSMLKKKQPDGYYHTETSLQLGGRRRSEPDEAELLRVSRRLVEDAVNRALQQYKQETLQNGGGPNATAAQLPGNTEDTTTKKDTTANSTTDNRK
ncbi:putative A-kinase anchor protein 7 [Scophthalmus maximus]|uniref:Putative A-kinase anchor protein 7 n=1 Tax=Scophthalmus maximus TaxID=52904 RepID=A0A2U9CT55_SCOMX|nr:putative A-kinase anchor protein 7 [Scophthalmus maximus]